MSESRFEGVVALPPKIPGVERAWRQKLEEALDFEDIIQALQALESVPEIDVRLQIEEQLHALAVLLDGLDMVQGNKKLQNYDLRAFSVELGIRKAIGRVMRAKGYTVSDSVFVESE
jgi:hypothetical protein